LTHPVIAVVLSALYAGSDEIHQLFVPGRTSRLEDVLIDTLAALAGVAVLFAAIKMGAYFNRRQAPAG
jgi:VanZ family protein